MEEILAIAQDNDPRPECAPDNSLSGSYRNDHGRYATDRVGIAQPDHQHANYREQNRTYGSRNEFVNNNTLRYDRNNVHNDRNYSDNHHHCNTPNHSELSTTEPFVDTKPIHKHTYEELKINLTNPAVTPEEEARFRALIEEYGDIFALDNTELPGTNRMEFKINMQNDARPVAYTQEARAEIEKQTQGLLAVKFIRHSTSPWSSNVLLVRKKCGEMRFCIDFRNLSKCFVPEIHPVPSFSLIHDTLSYAKPVIFSTLDLRSAFYCLKVEDGSIKYTSFQSHLGQFEFFSSAFWNFFSSFSHDVIDGPYSIRKGWSINEIGIGLRR